MSKVISYEQITEAHMAEKVLSIEDEVLCLYLYTNLFFLLLQSFDEIFFESLSSSALSDQG